MSAIDKTAQGTAVLEASGNAGAEAARRRRRLLMERRDAQLGKYRRYVRTSKGRLTGGRQPPRVPPSTPRAAPSAAAGPLGGASGSGPGPLGGSSGRGSAAGIGIPETPPAAAGPVGGASGRGSRPLGGSSGRGSAAGIGVPETPDQPTCADADADTNKKQKKHKAPDLWHEYEKDDDGTTKILFHPSRKDQEETALFGISRCIGDNGIFDVTQPSSDVVNLELGDFDRNREQVPMGIRRARADSDRRMANLERMRFVRETTDLRQRERDYQRDYERNRRATNPELREQEARAQRERDRQRDGNPENQVYHEAAARQRRAKAKQLHARSWLNRRRCWLQLHADAIHKAGLLEKPKQSVCRTQHFLGGRTVAQFKKDMKAGSQGQLRTRFQDRQLQELQDLEEHQDKDPIEQVKISLQRFEDGLEGITLEHCAECNEYWFDMGMRSYNGMTMCAKCEKDHKESLKSFGRALSFRSAANDMDPGPVPLELQGLSPVEKRLIARICTYVHVRRMPKGSLGYSGHSIHFRQHLDPMAQTMTQGSPYGEHKLPRKWKDLGYCVVRKLGNASGTKHKDFRVRRDRILTALRWLKANNRFYADVEIDHETAGVLPEDGDVGHLLPTADELGVMEPEPRGPSETGHKVDAPEGNVSPEYLAECERQDENASLPSSGVVNTVATCRESVARQRALNDIRNVDDGNEVPRRPEDPIAYPETDVDPIDETRTPGFLTLAYPWLFPYGEQRLNAGDDSHSYGADFLSDNRVKRLSHLEFYTHLLHYGHDHR